MPLDPSKPLVLRIASGIDHLLVPGMLAPPEETLTAWQAHNVFSRVTYHEPFIIVSGDIDIGRDPACDIVASGATVSRRHLGFHKQLWTWWTVAEYNSTNGTTLIREGHEHRLISPFVHSVMHAGLQYPLSGHLFLPIESGDRYLLPSGVELVIEKVV